MSETKKPVKSRKKSIADVDKPGDSVPASTSKPVIVTNRPILKDPMVVVDEAVKTDDDNKKTDVKTELKHSTAPVLQPLDKPDESPAPDKAKDDIPDKVEEPKAEDKPPADEATPEPKPEPEPTPQTDDKPAAPKSSGSAKQKSDAETAELAKRDAAIQHLIDSKKYELPINAVEKRKTKHFVALGIILAVLLVLAWGDIAADAGLIHISGLKPVTHFFSN